jgi:hypothetical protein
MNVKWFRYFLLLLLLIPPLASPTPGQAAGLSVQMGTVSQRFSFSQAQGGRLVAGQKATIPLGRGTLPLTCPPLVRPPCEVQWDASLEAEFSLPALYAEVDFPMAMAEAVYADPDVHPGKLVETGIRWNVNHGTLEINAGLGVAEALASVTTTVCLSGVCLPPVSHTYSVGTCDLAITIPPATIPPFGSMPSVADTFLMLQFSVPLLPTPFSLDFGLEGEAFFHLTTQKLQDAQGSLGGIALTPSPGPGWTANGQPLPFRGPISFQAAIGSQVPFHMQFNYLADLTVAMQVKSLFAGISVGSCAGSAAYQQAVIVNYPLFPSTTLTGFWNAPGSPAAWQFAMTVMNQPPTASPTQADFEKNRPGQLILQVDDPDGPPERIDLCILNWGTGAIRECTHQLPPGGTASFAHTYTASGTYTVKVEVADHHLYARSRDFTVYVRPGGGGGGGCPPWKCGTW